ncbi:MAG: hypothetical protein ACP5LQ_08175 [Candidatus Methanodesulfokora sp.]
MRYEKLIIPAVILAAIFIFIAVKIPGRTAGIQLCVAFDQSLDRPDTRNYMVQGEASVIYLIQVLSRAGLRNVTVANLSRMPEADLYLVFVSGEEKVVFEGRKMTVSASSSEGLAAATDRLLLEITKNLSLGLDPKREFLVIVDPSSGKQFGIPWLGGLSMERAMRVPVRGDPSYVVSLLRKTGS